MADRQMTVREATLWARRARQHGYSDLGWFRVGVRCPRCGTRIETARVYRWRSARKGEPGSTSPQVLDGRRAVYERESASAALDRAVIDHLRGDDGCTPAPR
jgi:hypothetical protein